MIISQLPELFVQRERALLGPRFDAMFSYPGQGAVRGASVNALRCKIVDDLLCCDGM